MTTTIRLLRALIVMMPAILMETIAAQSLEVPDFSVVEKLIAAEIEREEELLASDTNPGMVDHQLLQRQAGLQQLAGKLAVIKVQIDAGDLAEFQRQFSFQTGAILPAELVAELKRLELALAGYAAEMEEARITGLLTKVDALVEKTRNLISGEVDGGRLEALLVEVASLGQIRSIRGDDPLMKRYNHKLLGLSYTVEAWLKHVDYAEAGNTEQAIKELENLKKSTSFPVANSEAISRAINRIPSGAGNEVAISELRSRLNSIKDIEAVKKSADMMEDSFQKGTSQYNNFIRFKSQLDSLEKAWRNLNDGSGIMGLSLLRGSELSSRGNNSEVINRVALEMEEFYLKKAGLIDEGVPFEEGEGGRIYLSRLFDKQANDQQYDDALKTSEEMKLFQERVSVSPTLRNRQDGIRAFVAAVEFEQAGDPLMALLEYRLCAIELAGKDEPAASALKAISRISEKHPEIMANAETAISARLQRLEMKLGSRPYGR